MRRHSHLFWTQESLPKESYISDTGDLFERAEQVNQASGQCSVRRREFKSARQSGIRLSNSQAETRCLGNWRKWQAPRNKLQFSHTK
jgi:hypothetical protein